MRFMESPCRSCKQAQMCDTLCVEGYVWFLESWKCLNRYAWKRMDDAGRRPGEKFRYELPHLVKSPCEGCLCESWCDRPCSQRLAWWDARIGRRK